MLKHLAFWLGLSAVANSSPLSVAGSPNKWETLPVLPERVKGFAANTPFFVNGVSLWMNQYNRNKQQPVIFLHTGLADSRYFGDIARLAIEADSNVVLMDLRGHGYSQYLKPDTFTPELLIKDVFALIDNQEYGREVILVGWADGAAAVLAGLLDSKYSDRIYKAILLNPSQEPSDLNRNFRESVIYENFENRARADYPSFKKPSNLNFDELSIKVTDLQNNYPQFTDEQLAGIPGDKVAILAADHDEVVNQQVAARLQSQIKGSTLTTLKDVSYFAVLQDAPQVWEAIKAFLDIPQAL